MARLMTVEEMQHRHSSQVVPIFAFSGSTSIVAGTAVLIAPGIALTAQHVMEEIRERFCQPKTGNANLDIYVFQLATGAVWYVCNASHWIGTDIAVLSLRPRNEIASGTALRRIELTVDPPAIGETITAIGFPKSELNIPRNESDVLELNFTLLPTVSEGRVSEVHASLRDSANIRFPSFSVEAEFSGGMSGGPVFNERAQVCGLVCSGGEGDLSQYAVATSIWPACIVPALVPEDVPPHEGVRAGQSIQFIDLARVGYIHLVGHERIEFFTHDNGSAGVRRRHW